MSKRLFRGKQKKNGKWLVGCGIIETDNWVSIFTVTDDLDENSADVTEYEVIPETVGQYTGKEVDGEMLFTGDIVETYEDYDDKFGYPATNVFKSVVIWDEENFCYAFDTDGYIQPFNDWEWDNSTKIGNIHDNPELLKGGAE